MLKRNLTKYFQGQSGWLDVITQTIMVVWVVEFSCGGTKLEIFLPKNQHTQRKLLNFENWINGGLRSFQKSEF